LLDFSLNSVLWYGIKGYFMSRELTIGRVAKLAGVNVETIRYYQRRGLLPEPNKPHMGYRRYPIEMVKRLRFIKRAQALGFTLEEVSGLLGLEEACACSETRALAAHKVDLIDQKVADLAAMRSALADLVDQCDAGEPTKGCPIIHVLSQDEET
jgi:MerR family mercuric resistance operon transcriptional regulator